MQTLGQEKVKRSDGMPHLDYLTLPIACPLKLDPVAPAPSLPSCLSFSSWHRAWGWTEGQLSHLASAQPL